MLMMTMHFYFQYFTVRYVTPKYYIPLMAIQKPQYIYMYINHRFKLFGRFKFKEGLLPKYTNKYHIYIKYFDSNAKRLN